MITINVKPAPSLDPLAVKVLKSDTGVGLVDATGNVPDAGMPWPNGGLTLTLLRDGVILSADDPVFDEQDEEEASSPAPTDAPKTGPTIQPPAPVVAAPAASTPAPAPKAPTPSDAPAAK